MESTATTPAPPARQADAPRPLRLTDQAVAQVKAVMAAQGFDHHYLSVRVVPAGCSGLGYDVNLVQDPRPSDHIWEQEGVRIVTDPMSAKYLAGTEVDYVTGIQGAGFKFSNPNAKQSCGCGTSFTT